jgi:hypothetical protein
MVVYNVPGKGAAAGQDRRAAAVHWQQQALRLPAAHLRHRLVVHLWRRQQHDDLGW